MRKFNALVSLVLLVTTPTTFLHPIQIRRVHNEEPSVEKDYIPSYDDMLQLLDKIESGELENKCTPAELEKLKHFIAFLAKEGVLPDESEESLSLDHDIEELLGGEAPLYQNTLSFLSPHEYQYMIVPAVLHGHGEFILRANWCGKQWKHVKHFVKKHKKAIIIGAAVVVAAAVIVVTVVAVSGAAAGAAATGIASAAGAATNSSSHHNKESSSVPTDTPATTQEGTTLKSTIDTQITSFKENLVLNQFFQPTQPIEGLSWQENGRALGSIFAHDSFNNFQHQLPYQAQLAQELQEINSKYTFPIPGGNQAAALGHPEIDRKFSTDYGHLYSTQTHADFNTLSHQVRGERALSLGYGKQAIQDFGKAIQSNPSNPIPYLERGIAHFGMGDYDHSIEDYKQFITQSDKAQPLKKIWTNLHKSIDKPNTLTEQSR